jgi:hypothetical protein
MSLGGLKFACSATATLPLKAVALLRDQFEERPREERRKEIDWAFVMLCQLRHRTTRRKCDTVEFWSVVVLERFTHIVPAHPPQRVGVNVACRQTHRTTKRIQESRVDEFFAIAVGVVIYNAFGDVKRVNRNLVVVLEDAEIVATVPVFELFGRIKFVHVVGVELGSNETLLSGASFVVVLSFDGFVPALVLPFVPASSVLPSIATNDDGREHIGSCEKLPVA